MYVLQYILYRVLNINAATRRCSSKLRGIYVTFYPMKNIYTHYRTTFIQYSISKCQDNPAITHMVKVGLGGEPSRVERL